MWTFSAAGSDRSDALLADIKSMTKHLEATYGITEATFGYDGVAVMTLDSLHNEAELAEEAAETPAEEAAEQPEAPADPTPADVPPADVPIRDLPPTPTT
jgi:hypothetical protein